jgi:hypothetical protein
MSNLSLKWRCNNTSCDITYHRIDFNTPSITLDSDYELLYSYLENPQLSDWYTNAPVHTQISKKVRDNINTLLTFVNEHNGNNSGDYENLKSSITQLATTNDGKKRSKRRKRRSKSKRRKRKI